MVRQQDTTSTSSSIGSGKRFYESLAPRNKKHFGRFMMNQAEECLLLELANLHDNGVLRFLEGPYLKNTALGAWKALFSSETEGSTLEARNELRELWAGNTPATRKDEILTGWLRRGTADFLLPQWKGRTFRLIPNYSSLRSLLFKAILDRSSHFAQCHNPDCLAPYFLAKRRSQKYCERGDCTAYAQRQYALKWWYAKGEKRRQEAAAPLAKKSRKQAKSLRRTKQ